MVSPPVPPAGRSPSGWDGRLPRCRESWPATAAAPAIELNALTRRPSGAPPDPSRPSWPWTLAAGSRGGQAGLALVTEQIAGWLRVTYPDDPTMRISHETIYLSLYVPHRGRLRRDLRRRLRSGRAMRHPRGKRLPQGRGQLLDTMSIRERPAEANRREVAGHWEGDLVVRP